MPRRLRIWAILPVLACSCIGLTPPLFAADTTPPSKPTVRDDGVYTSSVTTLHATWTSSDRQSRISECQYQIRRDSTSGAIIVDWTSTGTTKSVTRTGLSLVTGMKYYVAVKAKNGAGLWSAVGYSNGITVDASAPTTPGTPTEGGSTDLDYDPDGTYTVYWSAAADTQSGITAYELQERIEPAGAWTTLTSASTALSFAVSGRQHATRYVYQVRAKNGAGLWSPFSGISDGMTVDLTPPSMPAVTDDGDTTTSLTTLHATWTASTDDLSGITQYQAAIGTTAGAADVVAWTPVGLVMEWTKTGLALTVGQRYYLSVQARNGAGSLSAVGTSDGIQVIEDDTQPPAIGPIGVTQVGPHTATINWTTDEPATAQVEYGLDQAYGQATPVTATRSTTHEVLLQGLDGLTTYHFRVRSKDAAGNEAVSGDQTFDTAPLRAPSVVTVNGRQLLVQRRNLDGTLGAAAPYTIRGVDWSPASRNTATSTSDANNANKRRPEFGLWYQTDLPLIQAMGANTVRLFIDPGFDASLGPVGLQALDECYRRGLMVIMTVDDAINNTTRAQQAVAFYKDHPAILMWSLGSEWNINRYFGVASSVLNAAQRTETAAQLVKALDSNHPVVSSYGEIDINATGMRLADTSNYVNAVCPSVDVWSLNIFRGDHFWPLFDQWASISSKPMFLGEFGVDAFHSTAIANPPPGAVNEAEQAQWDLRQWDDLVRHRSVASGGTLFEWNDEWWKVQPWGSQETGGWVSGAFPDGMGNEEYFGLVTIDRATRQAYTALTPAFAPSYVPAPWALPFRAISRGANAGPGYGYGQFYRSGISLYKRTGGGGGGRGFNVMVVDPDQPDAVPSMQNFDTWGNGVTAWPALIAHLDSVPAGQIVLLAVGDDAGLNVGTSCSQRTDATTQSGLQALEALGSTLIRSYCFRNSWAMAAIKGSGALGEQRNNGEAAAQATVTIP